MSSGSATPDSHARFPLRAERDGAHGIDPHALKTACSACNLRDLCMPVGLPDADMRKIDQVVQERRKVSRGSPLFRTGDAFDSLYAIRTGYFKTRVVAADGRDQVTGFQMAGEIVGLDGIALGRHACDAIALEDAEVCELPYERITQLSRQVGALQAHLHRILSREIVREHGVMVLLGTMRAEERLATFLQNLVQRLHVRGFSQTELVLRMTREEIGSYLGLTLETVSRTLSKLDEDGIIAIRQRHVRILDAEALQRLAGGR